MAKTNLALSIRGFFEQHLVSQRSLLRNWRHNLLNASESYEERLCQSSALSAKRQLLAQVTEPQVFVKTS
jgi:hypothetical protein